MILGVVLNGLVLLHVVVVLHISNGRHVVAIGLRIRALDQVVGGL